MSELSLTTIELPTAGLGPCSPLPMLDPLVPVQHLAPDVPSDIVSRSRDGWPASLMPYLAQDDYGREPTPRAHRAAVLENDRVRATVAIDLGGRLLSLVDLRAERELLAVNPVVQPANLALRNAWFSGGVEWNIGTRGHCPLTMDPLHAARVDGPEGTPMLRLWEWERLRGVVFQIDLWLPAAAPVLLARTRIRNLGDEPVPMYWWTNAAVVAGPDTRMLAPATRAFRTTYPNGVRVAPIPDDGDGDVTYPSHHTDAADLFFDIAPHQRPWIAAIDGDGSGVVHVSTAELRGRKLFVWGTGSGGQRWQEWLSHGRAEPYAEIQAGLAPTQFEHVTMPARAAWDWTEAFGSVAVDPARSHGGDWNGAVACLDSAVEELVPADRLAAWHRAGSVAADRPPDTVLATGSGWGALERERREDDGTAWFDDRATPFPESTVGPEQELWVALLRTGRVPAAEPSEPPVSYVVGLDWERRLAAAPQDWQTHYLRAVLAHGRGDRQHAITQYEASLRHAPNAWAFRGLARAAATDGRHDEAAGHAVAAANLAPGEPRLAVEAVSLLLDAGRAGDALRLIDSQPSPVRTSRLRLLEGFAAVTAGSTARAREILLGGLDVPDLREGERSIDQLWRAVFPDRPLPAHYDFRMTGSGSQRIDASVR